jgi:hypothetical protein
MDLEDVMKAGNFSEELGDLPERRKGDHMASPDTNRPLHPSKIMDDIVE